MSSPPSRYVQPEAGEARVERLWSGVAGRLHERPTKRWRAVALGAALSAVVAGGLLWFEGEHLGSSTATAARAVFEGAQLETRGDELSVTLGDGSSVRLASHSEVRVEGSRSSAISLSLSRGEVACDVTHQEGRTFTVVAGGVEVRVVGTRFRVKRTTAPVAEVEVNVERGLVEVRSARQPGVVARVAAGQSWAEQAGAEALHAEPKPEPKTPAVASVPQAPVAPSARELFERAAASRRAGDAAAAARAYEELLRVHPSDARASLAAFELGRLRMDRLGDSAGAVAALERAVATQVGPTFREDALARLVSVYASRGDSGACRRARDRYLASYPGGVHAASVASRCGSSGD